MSGVIKSLRKNLEYLRLRDLLINLWEQVGHGFTLKGMDVLFLELLCLDGLKSNFLGVLLYLKISLSKLSIYMFTIIIVIFLAYLILPIVLYAHLHLSHQDDAHLSLLHEAV